MRCSFLFRSLFVSTLLFVSAAAGALSTSTDPVESDIRYSAANQHGQFRYLIEFAEPGLLRRHTARAPGQPFDINASDVRTAQQQLQAQQADHLQTMERETGRALDVTHHYLVSHSGMALWLVADEAEKIARLDGVVSVERERVYQLDTYRGPEFIGAGTMWDGSSVPDSSELRGEDLAIAVLDTGVDPSHPSFANVAACGHAEGGNPDKLISHLDCGSTDGTGLCNGGSPNDTNGHGSHTASTAGGNVVDGTSVPAPNPPPPFDSLSGVAPCAYIRAYKVCPDDGCPAADIQAGMDSVLIQQTDGPIPIVSMNFSISGGLNPWFDNDRGKLDLVDAGIFVAASAGNTGPTVPDPVGNVGHRGPWVMSVANISHDAIEANPLSLDGGPTDEGALQGTGPLLNSDYTGQLRWAGDADPGNETGCAAFPANAFNGEAALIMRGDCNFSDKVDNAEAAGANFVVVYNNVGGPPIAMGGLEGTSVSSVMVTNSVGNALVTALGGGTAELTVLAAVAAFVDPDFGDVLSNGSLIGPTPAPLQHLQKPDIAGPGTNILAAVPVAFGGYDFISGTSMSSPHIAGAATLMRQAQPDWTVTEIKSALQMTAFGDGKKADGSTPSDADDVGSGRADLSKAALAGLVMDETTQNFVDANPSTGGDVRTLNLPAVRNVECDPDCSWTRTVRNTLDVASSWTVSTDADGFDIDVSPSSFSFAGGTSETETLTITATPVSVPGGELAFGEVVLTETGAQSPDLRVTVAIGGPEVPEIDVDPASLSATVPEGLTETQALTISNPGTGDLNWSILNSSGLAPWSEDFDSYDNGSQIHGQGGWKGWFNDPGAGALVSDTESNSAPHSVEIVGGSDLVREFQDVDSGPVTLTAWQFIPSGYNGESSFILLNSYDDGGVGLNWSTQATFNSAEGLVINDGASGGSLPIVTDQWVEIRVEIDLGTDTQEFYYNGDLLYAGTWTDENSGGGALNLGAIDLFANGATEVYYDDISVTSDVPPQCDAPDDLVWLDASPLADTTVPAGSTDVDVTFDASSLTSGDFEEAVLCISSNDPTDPLIEVPVSIDVEDGAFPVADITPANFSFNLPEGGTDTGVLDIGNTGESALDWSIGFGEVAAGQILWPNGQATEVHTTEPSGEIQGLARAGQSESGATGVHAFVEPRGSDVTITHSDSLDITAANAVACANEGPPQTTVDNQFLRTFTLDDFDIAGDFNVSEVTFGIENLTTNIDLTVNLYTLDGAFTYANLTLIGSATETVTPQDLTLFTVPVEGTAPAGSTLVVEIVAPTLLGEGVFFPGSNSVGETAPSYIASDTCGISDPATYADIGNPQVQLVMTVTGTESGGGCAASAEIPWLSVDPDNGSTPVDGNVPVDVDVDATGLAPDDYEALLCVNTNDPFAPVVEVPVALTVTGQADPAELGVSPLALDFGDVLVGSTGTASVTVSNVAAAGADDLVITDISVISGDPEFAVGGNDCGATLAPQESCTVEVEFSPSALQPFSGFLRVDAEDNDTVNVTLSGNGVDTEVPIFEDRFEEL